MVRSNQPNSEHSKSKLYSFQNKEIAGEIGNLSVIHDDVLNIQNLHPAPNHLKDSGSDLDGKNIHHCGVRVSPPEA